MLLPLATTFFYDENDFQPILISMLIVLALGAPLRFFNPIFLELTIRDAVVVTVFGWSIICGVSTLPFLFSEWPCPGRGGPRVGIARCLPAALPSS